MAVVIVVVLPLTRPGVEQLDVVGDAVPVQQLVDVLVIDTM
jgi:hypothetical protein